MDVEVNLTVLLATCSGGRSSTPCCSLRIMPYNTRGKRKQTLGEQVWELMKQRYFSGALLFGSLVDEARFVATSRELFTSFKARPRSGAEEQFIKIVPSDSVVELEPRLGRAVQLELQPKLHVGLARQEVFHRRIDF